MKILEVTDKNLIWQGISGRKSIDQITDLEEAVKEYTDLITSLYSTTLFKNQNIPGLNNIIEYIKNIKEDLDNYPDQTDPDIILANNKIIELSNLLDSYR